MGKLSGIEQGQRVRLVSDQLPRGEATGTVSRIASEIAHVAFDDAGLGEALVYEPLGKVRAVLRGSGAGITLDAIEVLDGVRGAA